MLAETARLFTSSPTPVDSSLCGSRGVRLSSEAPAANAGAAAFPATVKCARQAPSVNRFHHPRPFTTLVGSPRTRNLFQISGLPPAASYLTESLAHIRTRLLCSRIGSIMWLISLRMARNRFPETAWGETGHSANEEPPTKGRQPFRKAGSLFGPHESATTWFLTGACGALRRRCRGGAR
jgi:hypothetical protein